MRRLCVGFAALIAALWVLQAGPSDVAQAQGKKDKKEAGAVEIKEGKDGKFRFTVRDGDGKLLAQSPLTGFETVKDAQKAVEDLKSLLATAKVTVTKKDAAKDDKKKDDKK